MAEKPTETTIHLTPGPELRTRLDAIHTALTERSEGIRPKRATVALRALALGVELLEARLGLLGAAPTPSEPPTESEGEDAVASNASGAPTESPTS